MQCVVGGAGFVGAAVTLELNARGQRPYVVDLIAPPQQTSAPWGHTDLLEGSPSLPPGRVVLAHGSSMPRPVRPWTLVMSNAMSTARLAPGLVDRDVVLLSSAEVYGRASGPLREETVPDLPIGPRRLEEWVDRAVQIAATGPCSPHRAYEICQELAAHDESGRWVYAMSKLAQEQLLRRHVADDRLTILRLANVFGLGQFRFIGRMVEAAVNGTCAQVTNTVRGFVSVEEVARIVAILTAPGVYNVSSGTIALRDVAAMVGAELGRSVRVVVAPAREGDSCGVIDATRLRGAIGQLEDVHKSMRRCVRLLADTTAPLFIPPLAVVVPPRPERPDLVSHRMADALWSGRLRGGPWSKTLAKLLAERLKLGADRRVVLTRSGTAALRLAVTTIAGRPRPGAVALCPAYTFHATAEVLVQLGWAVRQVDVEPRSWSMDADRLAEALKDPAVGVVVAVDALGNPCDYDRLMQVCRAAAIPLIADSAPALGAEYGGAPVGTQADAHAFSMSFAKAVSAGGSGGAVVLPVDAVLTTAENWLRSSHITELSAIAALDNVVALDQLVARRGRIAAVYHEGIAGLRGFQSQGLRVGDRHAWIHWVTCVPDHIDRDRVSGALAAQGVSTRPYYEALGRASQSLPVAARLHRQALALPMSSELTTDDAERVVVALQRVVRHIVSPVERVAMSETTGSLSPAEHI